MEGKKTREKSYSFVVLLGLQSLSDVRDGLHSWLELVRQREVGAGAVDELFKVSAHALWLKPAHTHTHQRHKITR